MSASSSGATGGVRMKKGIHPEYQQATVTCVCGNEFKTRSTLKEISVEICSACHPFFTGQQKLVDSAGRVERFMKKYGKNYAAEEAPAEKKAAPEPEAPRADPKEEGRPTEPKPEASAKPDEPAAGSTEGAAEPDAKPAE
jgi:large subunit ribosomal protein L31